MSLLDLSDWLSYFANDANSKYFADAIEGSEKLIVPSIILTEVFKIVFRQRGEDTALQTVAHIRQTKLITLDSALALDAARYNIEFKLPPADSIIYATAQRHKATIWTQDAGFDGLHGVRFFRKVNKA